MMARLIRLDQIGDYSQDRFERFLRSAVVETEARLKTGSPVDTGRLENSWQFAENNGPGGELGDVQLGNSYAVFTNLPYAEPVITGENLPPSWNGTWRSRDNQIKQNYHLNVAKDMQNWIKDNSNDR